MLELSKEDGWRGTGDPIMAVKLARSYFGERAGAFLDIAMWRLLEEIEVNDRQWPQVLESFLEVRRRILWLRDHPGEGGKRPLLSLGNLQTQLNTILKRMEWHDSMPFRLLDRAQANDFYRFLHEVNDTHLKAHFCDIIWDMLPPGTPQDPWYDLAQRFPWAGQMAKEIGKSREWGQLTFLADRWESEPLPENFDNPGPPTTHSTLATPMEALLRHAIDHARAGGHGEGCWLIRVLTEKPEPAPATRWIETIS